MWAAILTGLAPQVLLRSRFTLMRSREDDSSKKLDISLDLDKIFNTWIKFIKDRIDKISSQHRRKVIDDLIEQFPPQTKCATKRSS